MSGSPPLARIAVAVVLVASVVLSSRVARSQADAGADSARIAAASHGAPLTPGPDKLQHASLSLSIGVGLGVASRSPALALGGAFALGVVKELRDRRATRFDPADLAADLAGATLAAMLIASLVR